MAHYYLNTNQQSNGDYEVHEQGCYWLTLVKTPEYLGNFTGCAAAVSNAKQKHPTWYRINGCMHCCPVCHTT